MHAAGLQDPEGKYEALQKYARDLTAAARDGQLDPVIGRDDEIRRAVQILSRRTKNNPVLIGEPGMVSLSPFLGGLGDGYMQGWALDDCWACVLNGKSGAIFDA